MKFSILISSLGSFLVCTPLALAQSGTLDQVSPTPSGSNSASFNVDTSTLIWQAQVRAGLSGQLEGFTLRLQGPQGATLSTQLRMGPGWNTGAVVFQAVVTKATPNTEDVFVDASSAAIAITSGQTFVIELRGTNSGAGILGSYVAPASGPALYPEPLFLNGPGCFVDCGWRIGFQTWVVSATNAYCFGDGSITPCPCGNNGAPGNGCASSGFAAGANLGVTGTASVSADSLFFTATNLTGNVAVFFQGATQTPQTIIDDGLGCVGGPIIRLGNKPAVAGASAFPQGGDPSVSVRGAIPPAGGTYFYQCFYRNAAATFCPPATSNRTNGQQVTWVP